MQAIEIPGVLKTEHGFSAVCKCGVTRVFTSKHRAVAMVERGACQSCSRRHTAHAKGTPVGLFLNKHNKWSCLCSGCGTEQAYTRKDHAKQSLLNDWQCKKCSGLTKSIESNRHVGDKTRVFRKFQKSAHNRGITWNLTEQEMYVTYDGLCRLTGWPISLAYGQSTASLDRKNSKLGYEAGNIQWVHVMVNMCKNKYDEALFVEMCCAIAERGAS